MTFVKLTRADRPQTPIFVNLDRALWMRPIATSPETRLSNRRPECTQVWFGTNGDGSLDACDYVDVVETPDEILALASGLVPLGGAR